jgi:gliding motility-associated transport system permease protein
MSGAWAVCRREFSSYFITPVGYVIVGVFAFISGIGFTINFIIYAQMSMNPAQYGMVGVPDFEENMLSPFLVFCGMLIMFIAPLVTMRLLAEERNKGTIELLLTHPLRDRDVLFGKFGAALGMLLAMMAVVGVHLMLVYRFTSVEPAVLVLGLATVFLMGAAFLSWGLFVSSVANSQVTAAVVTFGGWLASYILGSFAERLPEEMAVPPEWGEGIANALGLFYAVFRGLVSELPIDAHARDMAEGVVTPQDIAYYVLFISFFMFLAFRALEARRRRA